MKTSRFLLFFIVLPFIVSQITSTTLCMGNFNNSGKMTLTGSQFDYYTFKTSGKIIVKSSDLMIENSLMLAGKKDEFKLYISKQKDDNAQSIIYLGEALYLNICLPKKSEYRDTEFRRYNPVNCTGFKAYIYNFSEFPLSDENLTIKVESIKACAVQIMDLEHAEFAFSDENDEIIKPDKIIIQDKAANKLFNEMFSLSKDSTIFVAGIELSFE